MTRFDCPVCGEGIETGSREGRPLTCPRCGERFRALAGHPAPPAEPPAETDGTPGLLSGLLAGMGRRTRWAVALLAAAVVLGPPLALLYHPTAGVAAGCSLVLLGVVLHGHRTGCPSCRRWWSRDRAGTEVLGREVFERGGATFARSHSRTTYRCDHCGHRWSVDEAEEFRADRADPLRPAGRGHAGFSPPSSARRTGRS